jgi:hypothetical protein
MNNLGEARRRAFSMWLRTGRLPDWARTRSDEVKFNPWHDADDGRFTHAGTGRYFGRGSSGAAVARMHERPSDRGRRGEPFGGFGGGGQGFNGGGNGGPYPAPDPKSQRNREEQRHEGGSTGDPSSRSHAPTVSGQNRRGSDDKRTWRRFKANGYVWSVDETDLFREVEGTLILSDTPRRSRSAQARAGGPDRRRNDDGGHYVAPRFNGPTDAFNHFPQNLTLNRGLYRVMEDQWAKEKRLGKRVSFKIAAAYPREDTRRPSHINVWFWIDGKRHSLRFPNEARETSREKR